MWPPSASSITAPLPAGLPHLVPGPAVMGPLATSGGKQGAPVPLGWGGSGSPGRQSPRSLSLALQAHPLPGLSPHCSTSP